MDKQIKKYLFDILQSIESIEGFLGNDRDFSFFQQNRLLRRGIERELEIIGEATNRILKIDEQVLISSARQIVNTRNLIIHSYDSVADEIIWSIVVRHLPILKKEVQELLD